MFHTPTDPPDVTDFPVSLQRNAAEYALFSCTVTGLPIPIVQWSRTPSSQILSQQLGKFDISTQIDNSSLTGPHSVTTQLIILNLTITDQETYTCSGLNPFNIENFIGAQSNASASLFVNGKIMYSNYNIQCKLYPIFFQFLLLSLLPHRVHLLLYGADALD